MSPSRMSLTPSGQQTEPGHSNNWMYFTWNIQILSSPAPFSGFDTISMPSDPYDVKLLCQLTELRCTPTAWILGRRCDTTNCVTLIDSVTVGTLATAPRAKISAT